MEIKKDTLKVFVVGEYLYKYYEKDFIGALNSNQIKTEEYNIWQKAGFLKPLLRIEYYLCVVGVATWFVYCRLFLELKRSNSRQKVLFFWRPILINKSLVRYCKKIINKTDIVAVYNNDNPFSTRYKQSSNIHLSRLWSNFIATIPLLDVAFVYCPSNYAEYIRAGAKKVFLFPPGFPEELAGKYPGYSKSSNYDVIFIGYREAKRVEHINAMLAEGIRVKVYGAGWEDNPLSNYQFGQIRPVFGEEYFGAINKAKIALCFLSELNDDVYTRRNFEIPLCKTVMVSERTPELETFFTEGEEAFYFSSKEELISLIKYLLNDQALLERVSSAAYNRSIYGKYSLNDRVRRLVQQLQDQLLSG